MKWGEWLAALGRDRRAGIGLAIVHRLGFAMNAEVDVVNKNPGAEFRIVLPLAS